MEAEKKNHYKGTVSQISKISSDAYRLEIQSELSFSRAGQFISILCPEKTFRRPFSISGFNKEKHTISILFKLKGEGTTYLKNLKEGDYVDFIAPLGNGFEIINKNALLVGAGIGIAPMLFLKDELTKKNINNYLISGFKTKEEVIKGSDETVIGGSVLDNLDKIIEEKKAEVIYSCGPSVVLQKLSVLANKKNIPSYLALEKVMACSLGVCRGCVIKIMKDGCETCASVCKDGPVFKGSEIIWS